MEIGSKIRQLRINKGYSQDYMAMNMGISTKTYSKLEIGQSKITLDRLDVISQILEANPFELLSSDEHYSFNNCQNSGKIINQNNGCSALEKELFEKLLKEEPAIIELLKEKLDIINTNKISG